MTFPKKRDNPEAREQCALIHWCETLENKFPELGMIFAIPNGGLRNKIVAQKLKREGVKSGIPDLFLPVPRAARHFKPAAHGLFIEMKANKNKQSDTQKDWAKKLLYHGYVYQLAYSWIEAANFICDYLVIDARVE